MASNGVNVAASAFDRLAGASPDQRWTLEKPVVQGDSQYPFSLNHIAMLNTSSYLSYDAAYKALNPAKCTPADDDYLQFADIRGYMGTVTASQINEMISKTQGANGVFAGKGQQVLNAAKNANINEMYFFAHMMTETAWGKSVQAQGRYFSEGNATVKLDGVYYAKRASAGTYYNFIGWGAYDNKPDTAFDFARYYGWNTVESALNGAAEKLATFYVYAGQETLYEMRWDPDYTAKPGCLNVRSQHQYCTSTTWTDTIAQIMGYNYRKFVGGVMPVKHIVPQYAG